MSPRKLLRIILSVVVLALLALRLAQHWRYESAGWLAGALTLAVLLLALLIYLIASAFRKPRNLRDEVPKNPLGLE